MAGFTVQPESLGPVAAQLRQAGEQLAASWQPVVSQSQSVRFGRGDDMVSPLIRVSLEGAMSIVDSCVKSCTTALGGYADGLESMAKTYSDAEQQTNQMLTPQ
jgi:hypothetical protein